MQFSGGRTVQDLLRRLRRRYEVYINRRFFSSPFYFVAPQGSVKEEETRRAKEMSGTEEQMGPRRDPEGLLVRSAALSTYTRMQKAAATLEEALEVKRTGAEPLHIRK